MTRKIIGITGASGFVGQTLLRTAREQGFAVRALTRTPRTDTDGISWIEGALDQPATLVRLATSCDAIIHVAGVVNAPDKTGFVTGNVTGTAALTAAACVACATRFIHVSSLAAREPALSHYGASKAEAEHIVMGSALDWTIVRPPAIYGPGDRDMLDIYKMARRGFVTVPPKGATSLIEVSDLARLLLRLVDCDQAISQIYEVDDGKPGGWSHTDYAKAIGDAVGRRVLTIATPAPAMRFGAKIDRMFRGGGARLTADRAAYFCHPDWVINADRRIPSDIWQPHVETRAGLAATAAAYRAAGWLK